MIIDKEKIDKAKKKLGEKTPDIIAELLHLEKYDSRNRKALCPFHEEDTPSFVWNPKGYYFKCFGCSRTLDIIDAYMLTGLTFAEACEKVFELAEMPYSFGEKGVRTKSQYRYPKEEPVKNIDKIKKFMKFIFVNFFILKMKFVLLSTECRSIFAVFRELLHLLCCSI